MRNLALVECRGKQTVVRVWSGEQIPAPHLNLNFASVLPQFYNLVLPFFNLILTHRSAGNLEPRFGNHNLQTLGNGFLVSCFHAQVCQATRTLQHLPW